MIRGAFILGIGFSLGYAKALHDSEEITDKLAEVIKLIKEVNDERQKKDTEDHTETPAADVTAEAVEVPVNAPPATEGE